MIGIFLVPFLMGICATVATLELIYLPRILAFVYHLALGIFHVLHLKLFTLAILSKVFIMALAMMYAVSASLIAKLLLSAGIFRDIEKTSGGHALVLAICLLTFLTVLTFVASNSSNVS